MNGAGTDISYYYPWNFVRKFSIRKLIFYFAGVALILVVYLKWGEASNLKEIFSKSNIFWLVTAVFLQAATYAFMALNYHYVFKIKGHMVSLWELYPMAFIIQFINRVFPSAGISGQVFLLDYLRRRGATIADGIGRSILEVVSLFGGFGAMFIIASIIYFSSGAFMQQPKLIYLVYIFWFLSSILLTILFIVQRPKNQNFISMIINYFKDQERHETESESNSTGRIRSYWLLFVDELRNSMSPDSLLANVKPFYLAIMCQIVVLFLDVLTLYALVFAIDVHVSFAIVFVVFTFTQFISMISFVPGSLLVYEGGMAIILIAFGVDPGSALTLALLFRALTFWVPMPIGWLLYRQHEKNYQKSQLVVTN